MTGIVVHEWLEPRGGSEKVVDAMLEAFPDAPLYALWNDAPEKYDSVHESWIAETPLRRRKALALPFLPLTWRHFVPRQEVDWALVSSHLFAHHVDIRTDRGEHVPKFVYVHTPARYIWEPCLDKRGRSLPARCASALLKPLDRKRAQEAFRIAANSRFVRDRVNRTWKRDADVIYPPVDVASISGVQDWRDQLTDQQQELMAKLPEGYILGASRFVQYKRLDQVIRIGAALGEPVVIAGSGPEELALRRLASDLDANVTFIIDPPTPLLYSLYQRAKIFMFPAIEDFGIMPVEAMAAGCPVMVNRIGGSQESVQVGDVGCTSDFESIDEVGEKIAWMESLDRSKIPPLVQRFSRESFESTLANWVHI